MDCPFTCLLVQEWQFCVSHSSGLLRADQWSISVSMMWTASRHNGDEHDGTCASELTSTLPTRTLDARPRVPVGLSRSLVGLFRHHEPVHLSRYRCAATAYSYWICLFSAPLGFCCRSSSENFSPNRAHLPPRLEL